MTTVEMNENDLISGAAKPTGKSRRNLVRLGFVGLADSAPFFVAKELELFERHGLNVAITREVGWATVKEKIIFGELEAAHALCPLPFSASLGTNSVPTPCISGLILNRGGNAIVLSLELRRRGVRDVQSLKLDIENRRAFRKYIFATVYPCSTHAFVLRDWLSSAGIDPDNDVQLVTLPPSQMCRNLAAGTIDGFCAGDPWSSVAIADEVGWSPATSVDIRPDHPEKALMVNERFHLEHRDEHLSLIAALIEACFICDNPRYRRSIAEILSDRKRVNCSADLLEKCLSPEFNYGMGEIRSEPRFLRFYENESNRPGPEEAGWIVDRMSSCADTVSWEEREKLRAKVFRPDIYEEARKLVDLPLAAKKAEEVFKGQ